MTFHGGKLRILYYDLREDVSQLFGPYIDELPILTGPTPRIRHTMDVFVAQAPPGACADVHHRARLRVRQRLPAGLDRRAAAAVQPAEPAAVPAGRGAVHGRLHRPRAVAAVRAERQRHVVVQHRRRTAAPCRTRSGPTTATCGRRPTATGRTTRRSRRRRSERRAASIRRSRCRPASPARSGCATRTSTRRASPTACSSRRPGNNKQFNGFQRAFVVVAENASALPRIYRLRIENQPVGGQASFLQFGAPLTTLDVSTPALSSVARTVFVTAQDQNARIRVSVTEVNGVGRRRRHQRPDRHRGAQPDPQNPVLQNPRAPEPEPAEPGAAEHRAGRVLQPGHQRCARRRAEPAESGAAEPEPAESEPAEPVDSEPAPAEPEPAESIAAEPGPAERRGGQSEHRQRRSAESEPAEPEPAEPEPAESRVCRTRTCRTRGSATPTGS